MKNSIKIFTQISLIFFSIGIAKSQDYQADFLKSYQEKDTEKQLEILKEWEKDSPNDSELYVYYFNYYFTLAEKEMLNLSSEEPTQEEDVLVITDDNESAVGYIEGKTYYDEENLKKSFEKIDEGISLYPQRLDMRFGKIYSLGLIEDWKSYTEEITKTIDYSAEIKNDWTWTNNEKHPEGEAIFSSSIQAYQYNLYNTDDDQNLAYMKNISEKMLQHYPENIESMSNLAVIYMSTEDYDKAIEILLKAEKINAEDSIIHNNIANCYESLGKNKKAIRYYEKVLKGDNNNIKSYAKGQIKKLKQ